jgi:Na+-driven multidrug efflux pump
MQVRVANYMGAGKPKSAKVLAGMGFVCTMSCVAVLITVGTSKDMCSSPYLFFLKEIVIYKRK